MVTGAARGIGAATCALLEQRGWEVVALDRDPVERANSIQVDLADTDALSAAFSALPRIDGLVNNAAQSLYKPLLHTSTEEWDAVSAVNLRAAFECIKASQPQLVAAKGSVVNVASVHAVATSTDIAAYAAAKGGLVALTRAAALELAPLGVRVNAVLPGAVDTPILRERFARMQGAHQSLVDRTPLRRVGEPREIAEAISFLLDRERASFVTGQELVVDGGALARLGTE